MVGAVIRSLRGSAGLNQRELADLVGISPSLLSLIESDRREPSIKLLKEIARVLEIPPASLVLIALVDDGIDPETRQLRDLAENLLSAAQNSIVLRRLQRERDRRSA